MQVRYVDVRDTVPGEWISHLCSLRVVVGMCPTPPVLLYAASTLVDNVSRSHTFTLSVYTPDDDGRLLFRSQLHENVNTCSVNVKEAGFCADAKRAKNGVNQDVSNRRPVLKTDS